MVLNKPNLYFVLGGLGKQIAFTSIIENIYKQTKNKLCIASCFYPIFKHHPKVAKQFLYENSFLTETSHHHYKKYNNIIHKDPYNSNFLKGDMHLIDSFAELYGVKEYVKEPDLYINKQLEKKLKPEIIKLNKFIIVQFHGGESNIELNRGYDYGQEVVNTLKNKYPFMNILNYRLEHQPKLIGCLDMPNESYETFMIYAKYCYTFISIDSSLMHICSNRHFNEKGVCIFGISSPKMFGYEKNINLRSNYPDSNEIDPKLIIENVEKTFDNLNGKDNKNV